MPVKESSINNNKAKRVLSLMHFFQSSVTNDETTLNRLRFMLSVQNKGACFWEKCGKTLSRPICGCRSNFAKVREHDIAHSAELVQTTVSNQPGRLWCACPLAPAARSRAVSGISLAVVLGPVMTFFVPGFLVRNNAELHQKFFRNLLHCRLMCVPVVCCSYCVWL